MMTEPADWERELLDLEPSCMCGYLIDGEQVIACRVHVETSNRT